MILAVIVYNYCSSSRNKIFSHSRANFCTWPTTTTKPHQLTPIQFFAAQKEFIFLPKTPSIKRKYNLEMNYFAHSYSSSWAGYWSTKCTSKGWWCCWRRRAFLCCLQDFKTLLQSVLNELQIFLKNQINFSKIDWMFQILALCHILAKYLHIIKIATSLDWNLKFSINNSHFLLNNYKITSMRITQNTTKSYWI